MQTTTQDRLITIRRSLTESIADHMQKVRDIQPDSSLGIVGIEIKILNHLSAGKFDGSMLLDVVMTCQGSNANLDNFTITV